MDAFIGEVRIFSFNWAPADWAFCDGSTVSTQQYQALWAVIGNAFGGNVQQMTFGLPNLQGSPVIAAGTGTGLTPRAFAGSWGSDQVQLNGSQLPPHQHNLSAHVTTVYGDMTPAATATSWMSRLVNKTSTATTVVQAYSKGALSSPDTALSSQAVGLTGQGLPHENRQPVLAMNFCIALTGNWPPRP